MLGKAKSSFRLCLTLDLGSRGVFIVLQGSKAKTGRVRVIPAVKSAAPAVAPEMSARIPARRPWRRNEKLVPAVSPARRPWRRNGPLYPVPLIEPAGRAGRRTGRRQVRRAGSYAGLLQLLSPLLPLHHLLLRWLGFHDALLAQRT